MRGTMILNERFLSPGQVLEQYRDDPWSSVQFGNTFEPFGVDNDSYSRAADKKTTRFGLNPRTPFDTPVGICGYPIQAYWDTLWKWNDIPFAADRPVLWVYRPRRPERVARVSEYKTGDYDGDKERLQEIFSNFDMDTIEDGIGFSFSRNPLKKFMSLARGVATEICDRHRDLKHPVVWTQIMRRFYDGLVDDQGAGLIHSNEPYQTIYWNNVYVRVLDEVDRTWRGRYTPGEYNTREFWQGGPSSGLLERSRVRDMVKKNISSGNVSRIPEGIRKKMDDKGLWKPVEMAAGGNPGWYSELRKAKVTWEDWYDSCFSVWAGTKPEPATLVSGLSINWISRPVITENAAFVLKCYSRADNIPAVLASAVRENVPLDAANLESHLAVVERIDAESFSVLSDYIRELPEVYVFSRGGWLFSKILHKWSMCNTNNWSPDDYGDWAKACNRLVSWVLRADPNGEKPELWHPLFSMFGNIRLPSDYRSKVLDIFLSKCPDTDIVEYLKTWLNDNIGFELLGEIANDVFEKHYGTRPFERFDDDQWARRRKPRTFVKGDWVSLANDPEQVFVVAQGTKTPGMEPDRISVLNDRGIEHDGNVREFRKVSPGADTRKKFRENVKIARLMDWPVPKMSQGDAILSTESLKKGQIVVIVNPVDRDGWRLPRADEGDYATVRRAMPGDSEVQIRVKRPKKESDYWYIPVSNLSKVAKIDFLAGDDVVDEDGNEWTDTDFVYTDGTMDVVDRKGTTVRNFSIFDLAKYEPDIAGDTDLDLSTLKPGDLVRCVDVDDLMDPEQLTLGNVYKVVSINHSSDTPTVRVVTNGGKEYGFYAKRFKRVLLKGETEKEKVWKYKGETLNVERTEAVTSDNTRKGDLVVCADKGSLGSLTAGKVYEVSEDNAPDGYVYILDDFDDSTYYYSRRFEKLVLKDKSQLKAEYVFKGKVLDVEKTEKVSYDNVDDGDLVVCVNTGDQSGLTKGKVYRVLSKPLDSTPDTLMTVKNDNGDEISYFIKSFEKLFIKNIPEKVPEQSPPEPVDTTQQVESKYKVGDYVMLKSSSKNGLYWHGKVTEIKVDEDGSTRVVVKWDDGTSSWEFENDPALSEDVKI